MFLLICKTYMHWLGLQLATSSSISSLWEEDPFKIELTGIIPRDIFVSTYPFLFGKDFNSKLGLINRQLFLYMHLKNFEALFNDRSERVLEIINTVP